VTANLDIEPTYENPLLARAGWQRYRVAVWRLWSERGAHFAPCGAVYDGITGRSLLFRDSSATRDLEEVDTFRKDNPLSGRVRRRRAIDVRRAPPADP
jgi:hypothetical protein